MQSGHPDAPEPAPHLAARSLAAALIAAPAMLVTAPTFAWWLSTQGADSRRLVVGVVVITVAQVVTMVAAWHGLHSPLDRRLRMANVASGALGVTMLVGSLAPVLLGVPDGRIDLALTYQLWIAGTTAAAMAISGALTRMFVASSGVGIVVNTVLLVAGASGAPPVLAVSSGLYLGVLAVCQLGQRAAMRQAHTNDWKAQRLLDRLAEANERLEYEATHDMLTGIANRRRILGALREQLLAVGAGTELSVLLLDLDGFKEANDTYGHAVGDQLLVAVADRLRVRVGDADIVGRQGGDEFIVLVRSVAGDEVLALAEHLRTSIEAAFRIGEHVVSVSASVGVVRCTRPGTAPDDVLHDADLALYRAKDHGRNCVVEHHHDTSVRVGERRRSVRELRQALHEQSIRAYYQPVVDMETGEIVGAEALARWEQPDGTVLLPDQFLRALNEAGLDTDLGIHMALQIMEFRCAIAPAVPERFRVGLNVTLRRTRAKDLVDSLLAMRSMTTLTGTSVIEGMTIELNENAAVRDIEETSAELARARAGGLAVALDDFGTGHSSLTVVRRLPLDVIKIDRAFVAGLAGDRANQAVVSAVLELASGLDARVVAEGVETHDDARRLRELGCRFAQGFFYSPAVPGATLHAWLLHGAPWQQPVAAGGPRLRRLSVTPP